MHPPLRMPLKYALKTGLAGRRFANEISPQTGLAGRRFANENGAAKGRKFELSDSIDLEELFNTLENWNEQLKHSDFEAWELEQRALSQPQEPQP